MLRHPDAALEHGPAIRAAHSTDGSRSGSASRTSRSATAPGPIRPRSSRPSSSALTEVAALSSASGPSTSACSRSPWSCPPSSAPIRSVPNPIRTPASRASLIAVRPASRTSRFLARATGARPSSAPRRSIAGPSRIAWPARVPATRIPDRGEPAAQRAGQPPRSGQGQVTQRAGLDLQQAEARGVRVEMRVDQAGNDRTAAAVDDPVGHSRLTSGTVHTSTERPRSP